MIRTQQTANVFTYANAWKDQLTSYNDVEIGYDAIGNPDKTVNADGDVLALEWQGRRLTNVDDVVYTYNEDGLRTAKTVGDTTTHYYWSGGTLIGQKTGGDVMKFSDMGFVLNGVAYFYVKNLQGDVVEVVDTDGEIVASYSYDAWGAVISATGALADVNPIRYRGYYYDTESGLYYCQQRYYNPTWGRWISADSVFDGRSLIGENLYAYCWNNPMNYNDNTGRAPTTLAEFLAMEIVFLATIQVIGEIVGRWFPKDVGEEIIQQIAKDIENSTPEQAIAYLTNSVSSLYLQAFDELVARAKASGIKPIQHGEYSILRVPEQFIMLTIPNEVMFIDLSASDFISRELKLFETYLTNYAISRIGSILDPIGGPALGVLESNLNAIWLGVNGAAAVGGIATGDGYDPVSLADASFASWEGFGQTTYVPGRIPNLGSLRDAFHNIRDTVSNMVLWVDYKAVFGSTVKKFWKGW